MTIYLIRRKGTTIHEPDRWYGWRRRIMDKLEWGLLENAVVYTVWEQEVCPLPEGGEWVRFVEASDD
jgi:hypothetical protein